LSHTSFGLFSPLRAGWAARAELRRTNALLRPFAERAGYLTDEDFFRDFA